MKRTKILLVVLSFVLVLVLASCDLGHQCDYGEEWKYDGTNHWHECACGEKEGEGEHSYGEWRLNEDGSRERQCSVCAYKDIEPVVEHEHNYSTQWSKDNDYHWHACAGCNVPADKAEHEWDAGEEISPATEEAEGLMQFVCTVCEATKEESIPPLGHNHTFADTWTSDATHHWHAATCTHEGEIADKAERDWNEGVQTLDPTCSKVGAMTFTCKVCNATKNEDIDKIAHKEETVAGSNATCTETGLAEGKKCSACGEILVEQKEIPALSHAYTTSYVWSADNSTCTASKVCANDASHAASDTVTVTTVVLDVTASKVTYTYNVVFADADFAAQTKTVDGAVELVNGIVTVNAPAVANRVPSHDYVKFDLSNADAHTFTIFYSELDVWDGTSVSESLSGSGEADDPYLIQSAADLAYFAKTVNEHTVDGTVTVAAGRYTVFTGKYFKLTKSIDLNGNSLKIGYNLAWNNFSRFGGIFDGNNCSIRGLEITEADTNRNDALFGMMYAGTIKNLSVYGSVYGGDVLNGGIVGYVVEGTVENCTSYVDVNGNNETGGIVGNLEKGTVINCTNYGKVICTGASAGVIVGKNASGTVTDCVSFTELNEN